MREVFSILGKGAVGITAAISFPHIHFGTHDLVNLRPFLGQITAEDYHTFMGNVSVTGGAIVAFLTAVSLWRKMPPRKRPRRHEDSE